MLSIREKSGGREFEPHSRQFCCSTQCYMTHHTSLDFLHSQYRSCVTACHSNNHMYRCTHALTDTSCCFCIRTCVAPCSMYRCTHALADTHLQCVQTLHTHTLTDTSKAVLLFCTQCCMLHYATLLLFLAFRSWITPCSVYRCTHTH